MAWFQTVQKFFSRKSDPTYQAYTQFLGVGSPIYTPRNFTSLAKEGYEKNITVYRSVSLIAQSCAGIPWKLYRTGSVKNKEITSHPLLDLLANPNPQNGTASFIEDIVSFWLIAGNSYVICVRPRPGASPRELWVLRPDRITIVPGSFNIAGFDYSLDGHRQFFLAEDMLHLKMFAANNDWYGLSPVSVAAALIDQQNEGFDWNTAILQNMGRPSGALVATGVLGNDQYERLKKLIRERYTGKKNAGTPMLLEGGLDWKQFSMSPLELDWMESRKQNMRDISIALGVPPELLGDSANKTYCIIGSMRIMTSRGPVKMGELRPGDSVYSLDVNNKMTLKKILWHKKTGTKKIYRIVAGGKEVKTTGNHPFLIRTAQKTGTKITSPYTYKLEYRAAETLSPGDVVVTAYEYPDLGIPESPHPVDERRMEFLGAMLGDGFVHDYGGGRAIVSMAGIDGPVRDTYAAMMREFFTKSDGNGVTVSVYDREVRCISKSAVAYLKEMGVSGKAQTKRIPAWVYTQPLELKRAFLRGLFDTDGSVDKKGHISYHASNEDLVRDVYDLCIMCGLQTSNVRHSNRVVKLPSGKMQHNPLWTFTATVPALNVVIGSRNPSDLMRLQENATHPWKGRRLADNSGTNTNIAPPEHCEFQTIKEIEVLKEDDVYDIEVEGSHNFFAEHFCVHNSNYQEARKSFYQETILPLMDKLRDRLNVWLVPMFEEGIELRYDKEEVEALQEDRESLSSRLIAQWNAGLVTLNEVRDQLGLSELNGGDILQTLVQGHVYIPSDQLQQYVEAKLENLMAPPAPPAPGQPAPDLHLPDNGTGPEENNPTNAVLTANQPARPKPPAGQSGSNPEQANPARTGVPGASEDDEAGSPFEMSYGAPPPGERKAAQDVAEGLFQSALAAYFREEEQALHATLLRGALPETILPRIKALLDKREPLLEEVLKDQYRLLGKQRAVEIWKQLQQERKAAKKPAKKPDDLVGDALQAWLDTHPVDLASDGDVYTLMDSNFDPSQDMYWNAATEKYFQQFAFKRVQSIQQNTFSLLKKEIDEGLVHKETLPQIMVRIEVLYKEGFIPIRSKTIAQTELTSAFNFGGRVAAISAGIPLDKQWVAQADAKVRPAHKQAHGQTTDLYEPYVVNGEQLMYPGDVSMNASAENTINCRCSETYSAKKEKSSKPFEIPVFSRQDEPESLFIRQQVYPIKRKKARSESRLTRDFKAMREMVEKKRK